MRTLITVLYWWCALSVPAALLAARFIKIGKGPK
jgi:hypothetical protein